MAFSRPTQAGPPGATGRARHQRVLRGLQAGLVLIGLFSAGAFLWLQFEQRYYQPSYLRQVEKHNVALAGPPGSLFGRLQADKIHLDVAVLRSASPSVLRRAAGALPSPSSNLAIAAHRDTFFSDLATLGPGDVLDLETPSGHYRYRVVWTKVVQPNDLTVLAPTKRPSLTLITCYPFHYVGPAPQRYIVRAELSGEPVAVQ